jgi:hypothetical protein
MSGGHQQSPSSFSSLLFMQKPVVPMSRKKWIPSAAPQTTSKFEETTDARRKAETIKTRAYFSAQTPKSWDAEVYRLFFAIAHIWRSPTESIFILFSSFHAKTGCSHEQKEVDSECCTSDNFKI